MRVSFPLLAIVMLAALLGLPGAGAVTKKGKASSESSEEATPRPKKKVGASATPTSKNAAEPDATPKPKAGSTPTSSSKRKTSAGKATPKKGAATPTPEPDAPKPKSSDGEPKLPTDPSTAKSTPNRQPPPAAPAPAEIPAEGAKTRAAPVATVETSELVDFDEQPLRVRQLIEAALALTKQNLTYSYGSADPAKGGMDCSGAIYYLLRQQGFSDVARDASGQYTWLRKQGQFFAVVSKNAGGFEFADLRPGDLLFWSGTYAVDHDPPVTHTMLYLGVQRKRGQHIMWGSSDGRTYDGKARYGVSVFDFRMPKANRGAGEKAGADFLGYARIPGLRE